MENQFVPFELAVKLKELGFDEKCFSVYDTMGFHQNEREMNLLLLDYIKAPVWGQAFDWFRVNKNEMSVIHRYDDSKGFEKFLFKIHRPIKSTLTVNGFDTYEQARYACLEKLIELCKQQ